MEFPRLDNVRLHDTSKPLRFQVFDWYIPEDDKSLKHIQATMRKKGLQVEYPDEVSKYEMLMFGSTEEGHTVCAKITDFKPYFYVKIPDKIANKPGLSNWVNNFHEYLMHSTYQDTKNRYERPIISKKYKDHLVSVKLVKRKEFYGFTNNKDFYFMKITVKSLNLFNSLRYFFKSPPQEFQKKYNDEKFALYESGLTPFLRFIHLQDIKPCGWVELPANKYELIGNSCDDDSYSKANFIVETNYKNVLPYESNKTAPILIASFDIECTSSHGDFPVAIKDYSKLLNDLVAIAKNCNFTKQQIYNGLIEAYNNDVNIENETIHRLYSKSNSVDTKKLDKVIDEIIQNMEELCDNDNKDIENDSKNNLLRILNKNFPKLEGDQIIQIGTSVHRYGSPDIIYKNIISLKSCDEIDGVDVKCCNDETELLLRWKSLIQELSPDILIGYNIFGFDFPYIWNRANELGIDEYGLGFGRLSERNCQLLEQKLSSSALGDNIMYYIDMDGIILVDLLKVMQRDHKLDSYKLDNVAKVFIGDKKNDLKPNEIFSKFKGSSYDRKVIAEYCIQDCCLVNQLFHKLKILENNVGMGNVCSVPLSFLFMRGQGIKIYSLVANECRKNNYVIPDLKGYKDTDEDESGYEGAIVLIPKEGMYLDDYIVTLDFASLYPSSMIERNLSHDCYVNNPEYDNIPGIEYKTVNYDIYEGKGDNKRVVGQQSCKFVQLPNNEKGIIPRILQFLLKQRKVTRKKIEYETLYTKDASYSGLMKEETDESYRLYDMESNTYHTIMKGDVIKRKETYDPFEQAVLDALQLAYKVTANSLYGQIGARTSQIYLKEIAACTTATGRERILHAKEFVEDEFQAEVIYGDSVTSYTPVYVRTADGVIDVCTIESLAEKYGNSKWIPCMEDGKQTKEACELNQIETWTDKGWTPLKRVIRHTLAPHKKIVRVLTHTGVVDVTDDHSLLDSHGNPVTSKEVSIGSSLLHYPYPDCKNNNQTFTEAQAEVMGFFFGDGSCGYYDCESGKHASWALNNSNETILNKYLDLCSKAYPQFSWVIMRTKESSGVDKISLRCDNKYGNIVNFIKMYRSMMYDKNSKIIPQEIFDSPLNVKQAFWRGLYHSDGDKDVNGYTRIDQKSMLSASHIARLAFYLGYKVSINTRNDKQDIFRITLTNKSQRKDPYAIKKMYEIPYEGYVYDLTTENHHFAAGVGELIVHNTDSIFCRFNVIDENGRKLKGLEGLSKAIEKGQKASIAINKILPPPQNLEYEKTFYPFIIFSKKRYVGNLYEEDAYKKPKQKSMGIVLKRRDNAPIVKKIYGGIIDILLNEKNLDKSVKFLDTELKRLINNEYPLEDLIISKTLSSNYKNPESCAHKMLADRMTLRDPGNKPQINDRIPFVYIQTPPDKEIRFQGERIEHPEYIRENNLIPDYEFYITNQLLRPITQLYSLCLEELPNYDRARDYWKEVEEKLKLKPIYQDDDKRTSYLQTLKEREVEYLLFNEYITKKSKRCSVTDEPKTKTNKKKVIIQKHSLDEDKCVKLLFKLSQKKNNANRLIYESVSDCNGKEYVETILKGKKTKSEACTETLNITLKKVLEDYNELISEYGLQIKLDMPIYRNQLLSAFEEYDKLSENCEKAEKELDIGEAIEQQEKMRTLIIASLLISKQVKYQII
jgi:DNA polymerase elongation subunit (family B)